MDLGKVSSSPDPHSPLEMAFGQHSQGPRHRTKPFMYVISGSLKTKLGGKRHPFPHLTAQETEAPSRGSPKAVQCLSAER